MKEIYLRKIGSHHLQDSKLIGTKNNFIVLDTVDSTSTYLEELNKANLCPEGTVVFSYAQTAGKGTGNNIWHSESGKNITMSILLRPDVIANRSVELAGSIALGVCRFARRYLGSKAMIKWPNDIYYVGHEVGKISGTLITSSIKNNRLMVANVGIGFNVNQEIFVPISTHPVSLKSVNNQRYDVLALAKILCADIEEGYAEFLKGTLNKTQYMAVLYRNDGKYHPYVITKSGERISGKILNVSESGKLVLELQNETKELREFDTKEISVVL